jgi:acyl-CoA synthetase (NDP forming)
MTPAHCNAVALALLADLWDRYRYQVAVDAAWHDEHAALAVVLTHSGPADVCTAADWSDVIQAAANSLGHEGWAVLHRWCQLPEDAHDCRWRAGLTLRRAAVFAASGFDLSEFDPRDLDRPPMAVEGSWG